MLTGMNVTLQLRNSLGIYIGVPAPLPKSEGGREKKNRAKLTTDLKKLSRGKEK
jgi:hypothetical protein